jgi:hypothetical protein
MSATSFFYYAAAAKLPVEIIHHILQYDRRFIICNGKIVKVIDKLDKMKYCHVCELLKKRPKIYQYETCQVYRVGQVNLSSAFSISYSYNKASQHLIYEFVDKRARRGEKVKEHMKYI